MTNIEVSNVRKRSDIGLNYMYPVTGPYRGYQVLRLPLQPDQGCSITCITLPNLELISHCQITTIYRKEWDSTPKIPSYFSTAVYPNP
jgi:hypothetical protein